MEYKVLVCGSRDWLDYRILNETLDKVLEKCQKKDQTLIIVHGACPRGADSMADEWATANKIQVRRYPAEWKKFGLYAGPKRNKEMFELEKPEEVIAFTCSRAEDPSEEKTGTGHMLRVATEDPDVWIQVVREES